VIIGKSFGSSIYYNLDSNIKSNEYEGCCKMNTSIEFDSKSVEKLEDRQVITVCAKCGGDLVTVTITVPVPDPEPYFAFDEKSGGFNIYKGPEVGSEDETPEVEAIEGVQIEVTEGYKVEYNSEKEIYFLLPA
jgi:hypothetical protein